MLRKSNSKLIILLFSIILLVTLISISYAYFEYYKKGEEEIVFNGGKIDVLFTSKTGNNVSLSGLYPMSDEEGLEEGLEYEFILTSFNESDADIHYRIYMDNSTDLDNKTRFNDTDIKVAVFKNEELVLEPSIIEDFSNPGVFFDIIKQESSSNTPIEDTFKIKLWIADHVRITDTVCSEEYTCISQNDYPNYYFNKIVKVEADFSYDDLGYITYDANGGSFTPEKTSVSTQQITLQKPVMEGKGFLGWSSSPTSGVVEYKSGDTYTGVGKRLYAVYSDTRNVMNTFPTAITNVKSQITEVYFINDTQSNIDTRYNASSIKVDLTYQNQGKVLGWLEEDYLDESTSKQYYKLYVGSEGTTYLYMVYNASSLFNAWSAIKIVDVHNIDTSMVKSMASMFANCGNLLELDLSNFDTSQVVSMDGMFYGCTKLVSLYINNFNTSNVTAMEYMFHSCKSLKKIDVNNFDTSKVTTMRFMFFECWSLTELDLNNFDTSQVTIMNSMFYNCSKIVFLNIDAFDTSNVSSMSNMFYGCKSLKKIDLNNFDTSQVTTMNGMFMLCGELTEIIIDNLDTSNVINMSSMFEKCRNLIKINVKNFDTLKVRNMSSMFADCNNIEELDLSNWRVDLLTDTTHMFSICSNLKIIYSNNDWNVSTITSSNYMFYGCSDLIGAVSYNSSKIDITMANPDTGYFTRKEI